MPLKYKVIIVKTLNFHNFDFWLDIERKS